MAPEAKEGIALPLFLAAIGTRFLGGVGVGLLLAEHMERDARRAVGAALLAAGIASTGPLVWHVIGHRCCPEHAADSG